LACLGFSLAGAAQPAAAQSPAAPDVAAETVPAELPLRLRLNEETIRQAVAEARKEAGDKPDVAPSGTVLSGGKYANFARDVQEAQKPGCFGPDALKFQPAGFKTKNWNFELGGLFALPFWATAIARGKCN
jgi:hypothetical protein